MEAYDMNAVERRKKGIWYVVGSVPLLSEVLMLVIDRLHRCALFVILLLDIIIVAAAFACAALLVPRESDMVVGTRHCVDFIPVPGLPGPTEGNDTWFQSWKVDQEDFVCTRVEPNAEEAANRNFFRGLFVSGKLHSSFQMPVRRNRTLVRFQRGHRYLKGYITIVLDLPENATLQDNASIGLRLGGREGDGWQELGRAKQPLNLDTCESRTVQLEGNETTEHCVLNQRLFETASLDHQFYLLNTRVQHMTQPPVSMNLVVVFQNRLYTLVCLNVQTCFLAVLLLVLLLFLLRVWRIYPSAPTGHKLLVLLAAALLVWDIPLGYAALDYNMPSLGLIDAVRMDVFYLVFLSFCLIFVWEQAFIKGVLRQLRSYWRSQLLLLVGWLLLLVLDVYQQARQLQDVFSARPDWLRYCLAALLVANALYVVLVCVATGRSWRRGWQSAALPGRYRTAMVLTCLTAAAACVEHAERRESDNSWFWSWTETRPTGGHLLYIGMLVWYNVYVVTLLILYIPTRPLVELTGPVYDDEQKVPLNGSGDAPEPITRSGDDDPARQPMIDDP